MIRSDRFATCSRDAPQKEVLPSNFTCLFCNHENAVTVKLDKKAGVGQLDCRICGQKFQCAVNCTYTKLGIGRARTDLRAHRSFSSSGRLR